MVHRDERLVVVDKPAFLSSIPRGRHVMQSVVVRLRSELGLPELSPLHRLDRVTSGLLMLATEARWRGPYQTLFERRAVHKTYWALAPLRDDLTFPVVVRNHIRKERGSWQAVVVDGAPVNAETHIELESAVDGLGVYRLTPRTGRTHQLRLHMVGLGIPIVDDPLYPVVLDVEVDDFSRPLQLLAGELAFTDPVDGTGPVVREPARAAAGSARLTDQSWTTTSTRWNSLTSEYPVVAIARRSAPTRLVVPSATRPGPKRISWSGAVAPTSTRSPRGSSL